MQQQGDLHGFNLLIGLVLVFGFFDYKKGTFVDESFKDGLDSEWTCKPTFDCFTQNDGDEIKAGYKSCARGNEYRCWFGERVLLS